MTAFALPVGNTFRIFVPFNAVDPSTGAKTLADPTGTITMRIKDPLGVQTDHAYPSAGWVKLAVGSYYFDQPTADPQVGIWEWRVLTSDNQVAADGDFEALATELPS